MQPNKTVKLVFEQSETGEDGLTGCRVYLEPTSRPIPTDEVPDMTIAERWAIDTFDMVREIITGQAAEMEVAELMARHNIKQPKRKKEDLN